MKSATKVVRTSSGRTVLIVGNRRKLSTEAEIVQRVADEAGVPVDGPAYPRPLGAAKGEQLAEAEKTRIMSEVLRRGGIAHDFRDDIPADDPFDDDSPVRDPEARREKLQHFADKAYRLLRPVSRIVFDRVCAALDGDTEIDALVEPEGFDLLSVGAEFLDASIARATTAAGVISLAKRMAEMRAQELAAETKADEKPKLGGSSKQLAIDVLRPTEPKLESLHGYGPAAAWADDLVRDLTDYRAGKLGWADVDSGCLLSGPPGTGKTLFASALAASAGLPFISSSFAQWQGSRGGHLGDVVKALRETFATANANAPCILFIDELDSIPARGGSRDYNDYWIPIVNGLLECLDGTSRREGVVVLAASNHADRIDPALLRSGRLDRRFEIGLPDEAALARIFAHHLPNGDPAAFATASTVLAGSTSGADVARIAREARRIARRAGRGVEADDLLSIAMPADTLSVRDRRLAAVHEAGVVSREVV